MRKQAVQSLLGSVDRIQADDLSQSTRVWVGNQAVDVVMATPEPHISIVVTGCCSATVIDDTGDSFVVPKESTAMLRPGHVKVSSDEGSFIAVFAYSVGLATSWGVRIPSTNLILEMPEAVQWGLSSLLSDEDSGSGNNGLFGTPLRSNDYFVVSLMATIAAAQRRSSRDVDFRMDLFDRAISSLEDGAYQQPLTAAEFAVSLHVSYATLARAFRERGTSFARELREFRVSDAVRRLTNNEERAASMEMVAAASGFGSLRTMERSFEILGLPSPSSVRAMSLTHYPADWSARRGAS